MMRTLMEKKSSTVKDKNHFIRKRKILDYMMSKGYEYELVMELLAN